MLITLTLITVFLVVLALAGYLSAVAWALRDASRSFDIARSSAT